jgi:hypothetical protein
VNIFISVASYRDKELRKTVLSLLNNAYDPNSLHFGILTQDLNHKHPDLSFLPNLKHEKIPAKDAKGAGYARKIIMDMYDGQDYYFQVDSHMRFAKNWDARLITMLSEAQQIAKTDKVILSQFPAPYQLHTNGKEFYPEKDLWYWSDPSWTSVVFTKFGSWAGNREPLKNTKTPQKSHTILAGYMFAPGNLVEEVPYDPRISFMGEELCFAVRAYTRNWEIYAPNEMLAWHYYVRKDHPKVWTHRDDAARKIKWKEIERQSYELQRRVLCGADEGVYGVGDKKRFAKYQRMIKINFEKFYEELDKEFKNKESR